MRRIAVLCATAVAALVVGPLQAGATKPLSPSDYVSQFISVYQQIAAIVHKDSGKCGKMAVDLQAYSKAHKAQLDALNASAPKIGKAQAAAIIAANEGKFVAAASTIGQGIATCSTNKGMQQMLAQLNKLKK